MGNGTTDTDALSYGSQIGLNVESASPPTNAYIGVDDQLQVFIANSGNNFVRLFARILLPDGSIVPNDWLFTPVNGRLGQNFYIPLVEGFLLSLTAYGSNASGPGVCYVRVSLMRGTIAVAGISEVLIQGYTTTQNPLSWPFAPLWPSTKGRGNIRLITGTVPAAGAEISEAAPSFALWNLISIVVTLTCSAGVANRLPVLLLQDGSGNTYFRRPYATSALTAGLTTILTWAIGVAGVAMAGDVSNPLPTSVLMQPTWLFKTSTGGIQAADQYTAPVYVVEEWLQI